MQEPDDIELLLVFHCGKSCHVTHICTACDTYDKDPDTRTDRRRQIERDTLCSLTANFKYLIHKYSFKTRPQRNTLNIDLAFSEQGKTKRASAEPTSLCDTCRRQSNVSAHSRVRCHLFSF